MCSISSAVIDKCRRFATRRGVATAVVGHIESPQSTKRGLIKRFVKNQQVAIRPCGLFRAPAGSCGKNRTLSGYGRGSTPHQKTIGSTRYPVVGTLRSAANYLKKRGLTGQISGCSHRFFGQAGRREQASNPSAIGCQFNSQVRNPTRVRQCP